MWDTGKPLESIIQTEFRRDIPNRKQNKIVSTTTKPSKEAGQKGLQTQWLMQLARSGSIKKPGSWGTLFQGQSSVPSLD